MWRLSEGLFTHGNLLPYTRKVRTCTAANVPPAKEAILCELGARIRAARKAAGLTQEEAAHAAGMDWRRWQRIESGSANLTVLTLVRVARALRTNFWKLVASSALPEE